MSTAAFRPRHREQNNRSARTGFPAVRRAPLYPVPAVNRAAAPARRQPVRLAPPPSTGRSANVRRLPTQRPLPLWLKWLIRLQRGSAVVTFVLAIAALIVYSSTVYTQNLWSKGYNKLKTLERSERQWVAAREALKNQVAQQAERPGSGLVPKQPGNLIYLQPAPARSTAPAPPVRSQPVSNSNEPVGY